MKCLAIDDEPLALKQLESYVKQIPFIELVKTCGTAKEALQVLSEQKIDLMLIDVNMPDINGIDFVKSLTNPPMVIFITAYAQYAIDGFKVDAVDYLVKPFNVSDLIKACDKARDLYDLRQKAAAFEPSDMIDGTPDAANNADFIFVKSDYKVLRVNINDILFIESMSEYVRIYLENSKKTIVTLISMNRLEESLVQHGFMRVHRSYIVNLSKVNVVSKMRIVFDNDIFVPIGDMYKDQFVGYLNHHFVGKN
jgi:DNA-binding LytR/AlgR family response regulator